MLGCQPGISFSFLGSKARNFGRLQNVTFNKSNVKNSSKSKSKNQADVNYKGIKDLVLSLSHQLSVLKDEKVNHKAKSLFNRNHESSDEEVVYVDTTGRSIYDESEHDLIKSESQEKKWLSDRLWEFEGVFPDP